MQCLFPCIQSLIIYILLNAVKAVAQHFRVFNWIITDCALVSKTFTTLKNCVIRLMRDLRQTLNIQYLQQFLRRIDATQVRENATKMIEILRVWYFYESVRSIDYICWTESGQQIETRAIYRIMSVIVE
jgi:hypothetical protein